MEGTKKRGCIRRSRAAYVPEAAGVERLRGPLIQELWPLEPPRDSAVRYTPGLSYCAVEVCLVRADGAETCDVAINVHRFPSISVETYLAIVHCQQGPLTWSRCLCSQVGMLSERIPSTGSMVKRKLLRGMPIFPPKAPNDAGEPKSRPSHGDLVRRQDGTV